MGVAIIHLVVLRGRISPANDIRMVQELGNWEEYSIGSRPVIIKNFNT